MGIEVNFKTKVIDITSPTTEVDGQALHDAIEDAMASPEGLNFEDILQPEGKIEDPTNPGVYSQIILVLSSLWQVQFWGGSGYTRIYGAKLVGGVSDQPLKATGTAGDISVLESPVDGLTVVSDQSSLLQSGDLDNIADAVWNRSASGTTGGLKTIYDRVDKALSELETAIRGADSDTLKTISDQIDGVVSTQATESAKISRMLGLCQENQFIDNPVYDGSNLTSARLRTYSAAGSVGTDNDVLATYTITATFDVDGNLATYKQVKA